MPAFVGRAGANARRAVARRGPRPPRPPRRPTTQVGGTRLLRWRNAALRRALSFPAIGANQHNPVLQVVGARLVSRGLAPTALGVRPCANGSSAPMACALGQIAHQGLDHQDGISPLAPLPLRQKKMRSGGVGLYG
ncbi:MAG TPA: hypothetical protein VFT66_16620 [Roseiflexaceae bacterium]|nr:hypothetical protein [Roseiflexaceae bacterium]